MKKIITVFCFFGSLFFYNYIYSSDSDLDIVKWNREIVKFRQNKDRDFKTSPTSPMAGYKRITIQKEQKVFIVIDNGKILEKTVELKKYNAVFFGQNDSWYFKGKNDRRASTLSGYKTMKLDKYTVKYYPLDESLVLVLFNPDRDKIKKFKHLLYFPPDIKYRVSGKLLRFKDPEKILIPTSKKLKKNFFRYAKISFEIDNKKFNLTVLKSSVNPKDPDSKYLFIPFADKTSGIETYDGGRFIEMEEPEGNSIILDFNYCFNPLCNYAEVYNCTLPPLENELNIEIKAGEKTYPH